MREPSILSASTADKWGHADGCSAYPGIKPLYPQDGSPEAAEGTAAHELAVAMLADFKGGDLVLDLSRWEGLTFNGHVVNGEMYRAAETFVLDVIEVHRDWSSPGGWELVLEQDITAPSLHPEIAQRVDVAAINHAARMLFVWDFKFGRVPVEVKRNPQLMIYTAGLMHHFGIDNGLDDQRFEVHMTVVQPRAYHPDGTVRTWSQKAADLRAEFNEIRQAAERVFSDNPQTVTGPHCGTCEGRHDCAAFLEAATRLFEVATAPTLVDWTPRSLGVQLAIVRRAREHLKQLDKGLTTEAEHRIRTGQTVNGFEVSHGRGSWEWDASPDQIRAAADLLGVDVLKEDPLITPTQARDAGFDEDVINALSKRTPGALKLRATREGEFDRVFGDRLDQIHK